MKTVSLNLKVDEYCNRVLEVIKAVYGLPNKSRALEKLVREAGAQVIEPELREEFAAEVLRIDKEHERKYGFKRRMTLKEVDELLGSQSWK